MIEPKFVFSKFNYYGVLDLFIRKLQKFMKNFVSIFIGLGSWTLDLLLSDLRILVLNINKFKLSSTKNTSKTPMRIFITTFHSYVFSRSNDNNKDQWGCHQESCHLDSKRFLTLRNFINLKDSFPMYINKPKIFSIFYLFKNSDLFEEGRKFAQWSNVGHSKVSPPHTRAHLRTQSYKNMN